MAYDEKEGGCSAQMKCPHCGASIDLMATKGESESDHPEPDREGSFDEKEFREYMSPRNPEESA